MYDNLAKGKPSVFKVQSKSNPDGQHYVTVIGVKATADRNNLQVDDFWILDPASGIQGPLSSYKMKLVDNQCQVIVL